MRAERAWFLFRGERSPNRERDSSLGNRAGDESPILPLYINRIEKENKYAHYKSQLIALPPSSIYDK